MDSDIQPTEAGAGEGESGECNASSPDNRLADTTTREGERGGSFAGPRRIWMLSATALALLGLTVWKALPGKPAPRLFEPHGLKLVDTVVHLPTASFKSVDILLPCRGTLSLKLTCEQENSIGIFVVPPAEVARMNAKQAFAHLDGFDAHLGEKYERTARLSPGKYCLVLMDKSSGTLGSSRTPVRVHAHLSELN